MVENQNEVVGNIDAWILQKKLGEGNYGSGYLANNT
jgi:hypothetical protein